MSQKDKKMAVLKQLNLESEPITLFDLLVKLSSEFKERSVRRWLDQLAQEKLIKKIGQKRGTKYVALQPANQQIKQIKPVDDIRGSFGATSLLIIEKIKQPLYERLPVTYEIDWVESYHPSSDYYLSLEIRNQLLESGQRASIHDPAGTYAHQVFNRLLIDLSYNSSRLEGNTYSLLDTERLLLHGDSPQDKLDEEKVMILNHKEAIRYLVDSAPRLQVNRNEICTLHYLLSEGLVNPENAGKIRQYGVRIGGSTYIPFEDPKRLEKQLELITTKAALITNPFEQSIFLLVHISYLQAFADVNKRTARLSANIPLIKGNLVPLAFNDVQVGDYMSAMIAIYELQDVRPLVDLYVYSYLRTCVAYDSTVRALGFDEVRVRYRQQRRAIIREIIQEGLVREKLKQYVKEQAESNVPIVIVNEFIDDVFEDLKLMDESRLSGLGVTSEQFNQWLYMFQKRARE